MRTDPQLGQLIDGKYELLEVAGEGGMATVFRAQTRGAAGFSRAVAVKRIKPEFRGIKNYIDMFVEEARVGSELAHSNIVQVVDFCSDDSGAYYLVMEWIDGLDLGSFIEHYRNEKQKMPWPLVVAIGVGTLRGLGAAHERRRPDGTLAPVIHRDVSPHNVLLGMSGIVKLTDFGLARARDRVASLTAPGTVKGKLCYLSPEVSWGKAATPKSDLFAMGAVLWESLSGRRLFDGKTDLDVFKKIRNCDIPPLGIERPDIPKLLVEIIDRALAKETNDRHESAVEFSYALGEVLNQAHLGLDLVQALGTAVQDVRSRHGGETAMLNDSPTQEYKFEHSRRIAPRDTVRDSMPDMEVTASDAESIPVDLTRTIPR